MKHFPSWRYHREQEAKLVYNEEQDLALGKGWAHSPAEFEEIKDDKSSALGEGMPPILEEKKPKAKKVKA